jgi:hypothetical protein
MVDGVRLAICCSCIAVSLRRHVQCLVWQQVILNLVMNGIEAMGAVTDRSRDLLIRSCLYES